MTIEPGSIDRRPGGDRWTSTESSGAQDPDAQTQEVRPPAQRRSRSREQVTEAIMAAARVELSSHSPDGLSLRAVAREVGLVPSALYRYFASRQELLSALTVDGYLALGRAVCDRIDQLADRAAVERAMGAFEATRYWVQAHSPEFELMVSWSFVEPERDLRPGLGIELATVALGPMRLYAEAVAQGAIEESAVSLPTSFGLAPEESAALAAVVTLTTDQVAVVMSAWTMVLGFLALEMGSPLASVVDSPGETFREYCRSTLRAMGYRDVPVRS